MGPRAHLPAGTGLAKLDSCDELVWRRGVRGGRRARRGRPAAGPAPAPQDQPVFKAATRTVALYVTVTDAEKRLVPGLTQSDFEIYDNKKPVAIALFDNETRPITVAVMLDTSGSMTLTLDLLKAAAEQFLIRLLPDDRAKVGAFNDKISFCPTRGRSPATATSSSRSSRTTSSTATRRASRTRSTPASTRSRASRAARWCWSSPTATTPTARRAAAASEARAARGRDDLRHRPPEHYFNGQYRVRTKPDRGLKKLAEETGGGYFELTRAADLASTFTRVAEELHSQDLIGFSPPVLDGKEHKSRCA